MIILPATYDFIFKYSFGSEPNKDVLKAYLSAHLTFKNGDELDEIELLNPFLLAEFSGDKYGILDIKCKTKRGIIIDIEIQVVLIPFIENKIEFYEAKMLTEQVGSGDDYSKIHPVITILILAENIYPDEIYHHKFIKYDPAAGIAFSNLTETNVLELKKLPEEDDGSPEWAWGKLLTATTEEELKMLSEKSAAIEKAAQSIKHCSEDKELRALAESLEKARMERQATQNYYNKLLSDIASLESQLTDSRSQITDRDAKLAEYEARYGRL